MIDTAAALVVLDFVYQEQRELDGRVVYRDIKEGCKSLV
jgi:hypothetical protein